MRDSPEVPLLLSCVGIHVDAHGAEQIKFLFHESIDWTYLIQTALQHGVMPLLYRALNSRCGCHAQTDSRETARIFFC